MEKFINVRTGKVAYFSKQTADKGLPSHFVRPGTLRTFPPKKKAEEPTNDVVGFLKDTVKQAEEPEKAEDEITVSQETFEVKEAEEPKETTTEEMMAYLREKGVKFSPNIGKEKLKARYNENKK